MPSISFHFILYLYVVFSGCDNAILCHTFAFCMLSNWIISLCFSSLLLSTSAVWMYGFTDSPRKEASGSLVCLCQHVSICMHYCTLCESDAPAASFTLFRFISSSFFPPHLLCMRRHQPLLQTLCGQIQTLPLSIQSIRPFRPTQNIGPQVSMWQSCLDWKETSSQVLYIRLQRSLGPRSTFSV